MSDAPDQPEKKPITSVYLGSFALALDALYIPGNMSGRLHFLHVWPQAARFIFGEDLIRLDTDGIGIAKEHRDALEDVAFRRQHKLIDIMRTMESRSVIEGILQTDYVEKLIRTIGKDMALLLYTPEIVARFSSAADTREAAQRPPESQNPPKAEEPLEIKAPIFPKFEDLKKRIKDMKE